MIVGLGNRLQDIMDGVRNLDFVAPLALRIFLAPIFIFAGAGKLSHIDNTAAFFSGLGLPAPELMAYLAGLTEFVGGWLLLIGLAVRWISIPLMFTMAVAAWTAHWDNGWHALPETELTVPWEWREDLIEQGVERRSRARAILRENSNYSWITEAGSVTILKNGIEFAATYFVMLLALWATGAGRFFSVDYWLKRKFRWGEQPPNMT